MITKYSYLTNEELIAQQRDSQDDVVRDLCERLEKAVVKIDAMVKAGWDVEDAK